MAGWGMLYTSLMLFATVSTFPGYSFSPFTFSVYTWKLLRDIVFGNMLVSCHVFVDQTASCQS